jgi:hypothetical protein
VETQTPCVTVSHARNIFQASELLHIGRSICGKNKIVEYAFQVGISAHGIIQNQRSLKMPVDKAFEDREKKASEINDIPTIIDKLQEYAKCGLFANAKSHYVAKIWADKLRAGQKSISPEVREVLEKAGINYMQKITYADKTKPEESRCLHCLCTAVYGSPIEHAADCIVPISQKLLAKE